MRRTLDDQEAGRRVAPIMRHSLERIYEPSCRTSLSLLYSMDLSATISGPDNAGQSGGDGAKAFALVAKLAGDGLKAHSYCLRTLLRAVKESYQAR